MWAQSQNKEQCCLYTVCSPLLGHWGGGIFGQCGSISIMVPAPDFGPFGAFQPKITKKLVPRLASNLVDEGNGSMLSWVFLEPSSVPARENPFCSRMHHCTSVHGKPAIFWFEKTRANLVEKVNDYELNSFKSNL